MPVIARLRLSVIAIYIADHNPPHFHVLCNDGREAEVTIRDLEVRKGRIDRRALKEALDWAKGEEDLLWERWHAFNDG